MTVPSLKADLHNHLRAARSAAVWKLDGLSDYDVRRPLVATGTNLLGIVKHLATVEWGHFGAAFGAPAPASLPWTAADAEPDADMWAAEHETRAELLDLYTQVCAASDTVIAANDLDAIGYVPWWPEPTAAVTLQHILIHTVAEVSRHAGHSDIVRELIDGSAGHSAQADLVGREGQAERRTQWDRLVRIAQRAG